LTVGDGVQAGGAYYRNMASATTPGPPVGANADVLIRRAQEAERSTDPGAESLYLKACHEAIVSGRIDVLTAAVLQFISTIVSARPRVSFLRCCTLHTCQLPNVLSGGGWRRRWPGCGSTQR
jgi:hypothetical protein